MRAASPIAIRTYPTADGIVGRPLRMPKHPHGLEPVRSEVLLVSREELGRSRHLAGRLGMRKLAAFPVDVNSAPAISISGYTELIGMKLRIPEADEFRASLGLEPRGEYWLPLGRVKVADDRSVLPALFLDGADIARLRYFGTLPLKARVREAAIADREGNVYGLAAFSKSGTLQRFVPSLPTPGRRIGGCERVGIVKLAGHLLPEPEPVEPPLVLFGPDGKATVRAVDSSVHIRKAASVYHPGFWINCGVGPLGRVLVHEEAPQAEDSHFAAKMAADAISDIDLLSKDEAKQMADAARKALADQIEYAEVVGGLSRGHEQVKDVDLLVVPRRPGTRPSLSDDRFRRVEIFTATERDFEPQLIHWMAGKAIIHLKVAAKKKGMKLTRYGLELPDGRVVTDAEEIYRILGFEMPPHIREAVRRWRRSRRPSNLISNLVRRNS